jgi:hypothetical protein
VANRVRGSLLRTPAVYHWEELFAGNLYQSMIQIKAARALIRLMAREYAVPIPELRRYRFPAENNAVARASAYPAIIEFNARTNSITAMLLAHEMAHIVCAYYGFEDDSVDHGPIWLGVYTRLLNDYSIMPYSATIPSLAKYDLEHIEPRHGSPEDLWEFEGE